MERLFELAGFLGLPFWALMIALPRWRGTQRALQSPAIVLPLVLLYAGVVLPSLGTVLPVVAQPALAPVATLLGQPLGATAAWAHFIAFDLFVGRWIYLDARERGLTAWLVSPVLLLTLLLGPLGLGAYLLLRGRALANLLGRLRGFVARATQASRPLMMLAAASAALLLATTVLQIFDARQVLGASTWLKPAKFAASFVMAALTWAWMVGRLGPEGRGVRRAVWVMTAMAVFELVVITVQAARGVPSHFNNQTAVDYGLFQAMGAAITLLWLAELYLAIRAFRTPVGTGDDAVLGWGVRLGLVAALLGGAQGFVMPTPTARQMASLKAAQPTALIGAHSVGSEDGGPGLPVTGWNTQGGDMRVSHFLGLHGLQLIPLGAAALARVARRRRARGQGVLPTIDTPGLPALLIGSAAYLGLMVGTFVQALRGQALFSFDAVAFATFAGFVLLGGFAAAVVQRRYAAPMGSQAVGVGQDAPFWGRNAPAPRL